MADITPSDPKQPAYDAVFAYIRSQPRDFLPATVVGRNAMIWRAVHAALDAVLPEPATSERLALVEALVSDFIDPDPCWFDHHGYCQAHGWFATDPGCPHGRAKALGLEEIDPPTEALAETGTPDRVLCPVCNKPQRVNSDGRVRRHGDADRPCPGSRTPAGPEATQ